MTPVSPVCETKVSEQVGHLGVIPLSQTGRPKELNEAQGKILRSIAELVFVWLTTTQLLMGWSFSVSQNCLPGKQGWKISICCVLPPVG